MISCPRFYRESWGSSHYDLHCRLPLAHAAGLLHSRQENGLAHPDVDPDRSSRETATIWDGLHAQWLVTLDFDLADAVTAAFRHLSREGVKY